MRKRRKWILALAVFLAAAVMVLLFRGGYPQRLWARLFPSASETVSISSILLYDPGTEAWENSLEQLHISADVVFFGDSLTKGGRFDRYFPDQTVCNLGLDGDTILGMIQRVNMIASVSPSKVFLMGGINSLHEDTLDRCVREYGLLLSRIFMKCSAEVYILSVLPVAQYRIEEDPGDCSVIMAFNEELQSLAEQYGCTYIDLFSRFADSEGFILPQLTLDGVHLTEEGYRVWTEAISGYV